MNKKLLFSNALLVAFIIHHKTLDNRIRPAMARKVATTAGRRETGSDGGAVRVADSGMVVMIEADQRR